MGSKTALVTGASSGIGLELAKLFARDDYSLVLVASHEETLARIAGELASVYTVAVKWIRKDLSSPQAAQEIFEELERESVDVAVLVNNAGVGLWGPFAENDLDAELRMMQLNMASLTSLTKLFSKKMLSKGEGKILNVASTVAFQAGPLMAVYYATKAYVLLFSEALSNEFRGAGVSVSVLCPGPTRTGFQKRSNLWSSRLMGSKLFDWLSMDARKVAAAGYRGLMRRRVVIVPGLKNKWLVFSTRLVPRSLASRFARLIQERRH